MSVSLHVSFNLNSHPHHVSLLSVPIRIPIDDHVHTTKTTKSTCKITQNSILNTNRKITHTNHVCDRIGFQFTSFPTEEATIFLPYHQPTCQSYYNQYIQCPNAGFQDSGKNANLLKTIAVGSSNQIGLISMFIDMFELSHIDQIMNNKTEFRTETEWVEKCNPFFKNYKQNINAKNIIRRAMTEFKHRLAGSGLQEMIVNKIEDNINIYIEYILQINNIIKNIMDSNKEILPLQIDVVILGREHDEKNNIAEEKIILQKMGLDRF